MEDSADAPLTLIAESAMGRAFEVTPEREIVWEYYATARFEDKIAQVYDAKAIVHPSPWLAEKLAAAPPARDNVPDAP